MSLRISDGRVVHRQEDGRCGFNPIDNNIEIALIDPVGNSEAICVSGCRHFGGAVLRSAGEHRILADDVFRAIAIGLAFPALGVFLEASPPTT
jgi:hypothetical protein